MRNNLAGLAARYTQVVTGIQKHLGSVPTVVLLGVTYAPADLVKLFQSFAAAIAAVTAAKTQYHAAVLAEQALSKTVQAVYLALEQFVRNQFGQAPDIIGDFGYTPKKTPVKSPETLVQAAEKARATRVARHTLGKNQKKDITGASPAPAVPPPAPAPVAKS